MYGTVNLKKVLALVEHAAVEVIDNIDEELLDDELGDLDWSEGFDLAREVYSVADRIISKLKGEDA